MSSKDASDKSLSVKKNERTPNQPLYLGFNVSKLTMEQRIKVGIYVDNRNYPDVDLRFPEKGNPGIGGTEFLEIALSYYLELFHSDKVEVFLFTHFTHLLPSSLMACFAIDVADAAVKSKEKECNVFIFSSKLITEQLCQTLSQLNIKAIARSTNHLDIFQLNLLANCPAIKRHCCDGHEYLDLLRDHKVFKKSTLIVDFLNTVMFTPNLSLSKDENTVVYVGNITFCKGFHVLARVWPHIIRQRPNAKLIVIGSGKLYNRDQQVGQWGIAEENYEVQYIRPFLTDTSGQLMKSVFFAGLLGTERIKIFQRAIVGVINPTGLTEVFPGSALEIQASGTPVVSVAKWGLLDTVVHGNTGLLGKTDKDLVRNIIYLLDNPEIAKQLGQNGIDFVKRNCDPRIVTKQWIELLIDIVNGRPSNPPPMKQNYLYNVKIFRENIRFLKENIPLLHDLPALAEIKPLLKKKLKFVNLPR